MRLKSIKLAGFKSFVDPTTVHFPGNMCAVVGPNGCGKSNIIDAVRWVMGESSARHLRGESMADVIFNGAAGRSPVSQASIELVFDNSSMTLQGEFAAYSEISIRRKVTRDAQSFYYLNGNKCRRRDITDIFLGTGLGPRSYAIIEQGMISRLIESRPEELRVFIEEAAGISRYKERRKETENRIKRTRENLERLGDVREELERQLQTLQKQARTAERYREYKAEERNRKALLATLRWLTLDQDRSRDVGQLRDQEVEVEKLLAERVRNERLLDEQREQRRLQASRMDALQGAFYQAGAEIAGLEQQIRAVQERRAQLLAEQVQLQEQRDVLGRETAVEQETLATLDAEVEGLAPLLEEEGLVEQAAVERLEQAEEAMQQWQRRADEQARQAAQQQRQAEVAQSRIQQAERSLQWMAQQVDRLQEEARQVGDDDEPTLLLHQERLAELDEGLMAQQDLLQDLLEQTRTAAEDGEAAARRLQAAQTSIQALRGEQSALTALQQAAEQDHRTDLEAWLGAAVASPVVRLLDRLDVEPAWEEAVEVLLGERLQAVLSPSALPSLLNRPAPGKLPEGLVLVGQADAVADPGPFLRAAPAAVGDWLAGAVPASDHADALGRLGELGEQQYFLLPCGTRIGATWVVAPPVRDSARGSLARQKRLLELVELLDAGATEVAHIEADRARCLALAREGRERELEAQAVIAQINRQILHEKTCISAEEVRRENRRRRRDAIALELAELHKRQSEETFQLEALREDWQAAMAALETLVDDGDALQTEREGRRRALDDCRAQARQARDRLHQAQMRGNALVARREGLQQSLRKSLDVLQRAVSRQAWLDETLAALGQPEQSLQASLAAALAERVQRESRLQEARQVLERTDENLRGLEQQRLALENQVQAARQTVERLRLTLREAELRQQTLLEQIEACQTTLAACREQMPEGASEATLEADIQSLATRIERLGAINLAAIDEYAAQAQRKAYLDEQNADLVQALETLENAIRKIDRETRQKFRETFDQVNASLQYLFPRVFGGGSASLELTSEDLLETGVSIMARPPGKKNSTIHLLSGGEKALTAIALVFAIFRLNPAPFCMLDEVDAPLDDANVGRYARMVKEMSAQVQFIYISHNKIAMEMADHLLGVTMHEPGVSRMVTVDVDAAVALAGA